MKRVVSSSIVSVVILLLIAGAFFYFQIQKNENASVFKVIPADVAFLVSLNPSSGDLQRIAKSNFFNASDSVAEFKKWKSLLLYFDSVCVNDDKLRDAFEKSRLFCSGHVSGSSSIEFMFFSSLGGTWSGRADELLRKVFRNKEELQSRTYNGVEIHELSLSPGSKFSWAVAGAVFIGSTASYLVEDAIRLQKGDQSESPAMKLEQAWPTDPNKTMVAFRYEGLSKWINTCLAPESTDLPASLEKLGEWTYLQLELHTGMFAFKGETSASDTLSFIHCFDGQEEVDRKLIDWLPAKTAAAVMWGMSDPSKFFMELEKRSGAGEFKDFSQANAAKFKDWIGSEIALIITQPAVNLNDNNFMAMLSVRDSLKCAKSLSNFAGQAAGAVEYYNGYAIRFIDKPDLLKGVFGKLFHRVNRFYYTAVNEHIVVANQASVLRGYINDVRTGNLLSHEDRFKSLSVRIPAKGNILLYAGIPSTAKVIKSIAAGDWKNWLNINGSMLNNWNGFTFSLSSRNGIFHTSGGLGYFDNTNTGPQLLWNAKLDTSLASGPFFPAGSNGLILAEDVNQQLYAFDPSGELKWKKKLETPLLGTIAAVDYYRNGNHQILFNTHSFIYLLDSAGNNTGNYPFRLPAEASAGMTLIKDEKDGQAKYYLPCKNLRLYAYSLTGKPLPGFSPMKLPGVITVPVYYNPERTQLVLLEEKGLCFVAAMNGERLFTVKGTLQTYENSLFFKSMKASSLFSFHGIDGAIYEVDSTGEIARVNVNTEDSVFCSASSDINGDGEYDWIIGGSHSLRALTSDGVTLFRFNPDGKIDAISVLSSGKKEYIFVSSSHKIYLFNRDGSLNEGFPVSGSGVPSVSVSGTNEIYMVVKDGIDNISMYLIP